MIDTDNGMLLVESCAWLILIGSLGNHLSVEFLDTSTSTWNEKSLNLKVEICIFTFKELIKNISFTESTTRLLSN